MAVLKVHTISLNYAAIAAELTETMGQGMFFNKFHNLTDADFPHKDVTMSALQNRYHKLKVANKDSGADDKKTSPIKSGANKKGVARPAKKGDGKRTTTEQSPMEDFVVPNEDADGDERPPTKKIKSESRTR